MKNKKPAKLDNRPRFGYCRDLDRNPQIITEDSKGVKTARQVAVIPLPYMSPKVRAKVRAFVNGTLWPATPAK
jgi:hypothetical protein